MNSSLMPQLKALFEQIQERIQIACEQFPWTNQVCYVSWLAQTYEYAVCSTRILALAGGRMPLDKTNFATRFIAHAAEEKGHEFLLEKDVKSFGLKVNDLLVLPEAKAFHQSLYYWLGFANPVGMFGWVLALEGVSVRNVPKILDICNKAYGPEATTFLKVHAAEEEDHLEKAFAAVKALNDDEIRLVSDTLYQYGYLYENLLYKIKAKFENSTNMQAIMKNSFDMQ